MYHMGELAGGWLSVPNDGVITINAGFSSFQLKVNVTNDTFAEGYDSLAFTVAQTANSVGLEDSWWVPSLVNLLDAVGTGTAALPRTITAGATTPGLEGSTTPATATYNITGGGGAGSGYASTQVRVSLYGLGGAVPGDYSTFSYRMGTSGSWLSATNNGLITIDSTATTFQLSALAVSDNNAETGEGISFNVAQTTSSIGLVDSWWVQSTVDLQDVAAVYTIRTGSIGPDHFTALGAQERFVIPAGTSLAFANGATGALGGDASVFLSGESFDTITNYAVGMDQIDLPITVNLIGTPTTPWATEEALIAAAQATGVGAFGTDQVYIHVIAGTVPLAQYLFVDNNGNGNWDPATDTMIKLVGVTGGTLTTADFV
jgi:hypothetical protein